MGNILHTDHEIAGQVIDKCDVCYLGMTDLENKPYVLPFNFGYKNQTIYFHSGPGGIKLDILKANPDVCVTFSTDHQLFHRHEQVACSYGMRYRSVIAKGPMEFVEDFDQKVEIMNIIMRKYTGKDFSYNAPAINNVIVFKMIPVVIETKISNL
jgi:uncharacterized protein